MSTPKYSIGIDLGTTNCALACAPLESEISNSGILSIPQWDTASTLTESDTLPSFLYRPTEEEAKHIKGKAGGGDWITGVFARDQTTVNPSRVVLSAKSWLSTSGIDQKTNFLPWGSEQLSEAEKLSPLRASALLLDYLRSSWEDAFKGERFGEQQITITVPASFDAASQRLTLQAAYDAGFPTSVRLLEEPQAAFCRWLETNDATAAFEKSLPELAERSQCVLVVDIGGGTSDFSLFEVRVKKNRKLPEIKRVAVSDHILLGGDNIDLAMAHVVAEVQLEGSLSPDQWSHLIAQCRNIKEEVLANPDRTEPFKLAIPGSGSSLFDSTLTAELSPEDLQVILFDGFYPECEADERPERASAGLREFGLPYAKDSGITRHLAEFLRDRPKVDAVLFNGGSLKPESIRDRLTAVIGKWQEAIPAVLPNPEPDLAVARGAASYGWLLQHQSERIEAGAPRSIFLEVQSNGEEPSLVCVLPKGTPQEEEVVIDGLNFELQANKPVSFQLLSSTRLDDVKAGEVLSKVKGKYELNRLPVLETVAKADGADTIPIYLSAKLNAIGLFQLECVDQQNLECRWPMEFSLSGASHPAAAQLLKGGNPTGKSKVPQISSARFESARGSLESLFSRQGDKLTFNRVTKSIEKVLGQPKQDWSAVSLRKLWESHTKCFRHCYLSPEHQETWLAFAGFLLRPGFGVQFDEERIDRLWRPEDSSYDFSGKRIDLARYVLWRRVSGGLNRQRQEKLAVECSDKMRNSGKPSAEAVRLIGALERIGVEQKGEFCDLLVSKGREIADSGGYSDPYWVSLMLLLNRAPVYAGPETVLPADEVAMVFDRLRKLDWTEPAHSSIIPLFLRAARQVDNPQIDVPKKLRKDILAKLRRSDVAPVKMTPVEQFVEVERIDQVSLLGDQLPPGLVLK